MDRNRNYMPALTAWRGIAALCILVHHITLKFLPQLGDFFSQYTRFFEKSYLWVDFFFILSGFLLSTLYRDLFLSKAITYRDFIVRRFARIYPLHFVILLGFLFFQILYWLLGDQSAFTQNFSVVDLFRNILMLQAVQLHPTLVSWNGPAWSISAEWWVYLSFPVLLFLLANVNSRRRAFLLLFILFLALTLIGNIHLFELDLTGYLGLMRCLIEFTMGMVLSYLLSIKAVKVPYKMWWQVFLVFTLFASLHFRIPAVFSVLVMLAIIAALSQSDANTDIGKVWRSSIFQKLGDYSYAIYMVHWLVFFVINRIYSIVYGEWPSTVDSAVVQGVLFFVSFFTTLVCAALSFHFIEKTSRKRIVKLLSKPRKM